MTFLLHVLLIIDYQAVTDSQHHYSLVIYYFVSDDNMYFCITRMFGSTMEYTTRNEKGEYEVARGISANVFKCILVRFRCFYYLFDNSV